MYLSHKHDWTSIGTYVVMLGLHVLTYVICEICHKVIVAITGGHIHMSVHSYIYTDLNV